MDVLGFICCAAIIIFAGSKLSLLGDLLAEQTSLGKSFIGFILLATVTSLPELITGISSATFVNAPDLAVGEILGSCAFNMVILALLDIFSKKQPITSKAGNGHIVTAMLGIILFTVVALSFIFKSRIPSVAHVDAYSVFIM